MTTVRYAPAGVLCLLLNIAPRLAAGSAPSQSAASSPATPASNEATP
jgi:hypothetical protein